MRRTAGAVMRASACLGLLWASVAGAQTHAVDTTVRDFMHARAYGTGGAYRSLGLGAEAINGNPAVLSLFQRYQTELAGAWEINGRMAFGTIAILDSISNRIAAGVSYHFASVGTRGNTRTVNMEALALALPAADWVHFGISVRHLLMYGADSANAVTGDAGLAFRFFNSFHLAVGAHNVVETTHEELAPYYSASVGYVGQTLSLAADVRADFNARRVGGGEYTGWNPGLSFSVGGEYILAVIPVRAGYQYDAITGSRYLSAGLGVMTETGNIDVAYRHELNGSGRLISLGVRLGN